MRRILSTGSFLVFGLFGLYYMFALFSASPDAPTSGTHLEEAPSEVGIAVAQTDSRMPGSYPTEDFTEDAVYKVVRVIDGDTVKIDYNGKATNVRLIGVDTPETVHPNKPVEAYGKEASNFVKNLLQGESVYLRYDAERTDTFGRLLAYLYRAPDGLFVNLEIVRQGYGHVYTRFPFRYMELFQYYGNRARTAGKGLYGSPQPDGEAADTSAAVESESKDGVYVTQTGKKYHREGCLSLRRSKIPIALEEAKKRNFGPCGRCNPPQ